MRIPTGGRGVAAKLRALAFAALAIFSARGALALAPTAFFPAKGEAKACADTALRLTFDAPPTKGASGSIRIYKASDDALVKQIDAVNPTSGRPNPDAARKPVGARKLNYLPIIIDGADALIDPTNSLFEYGATYYVKIDPEVFPGWGGIDDAKTWTFTVKAKAPQIDSDAGMDIHVAADGSADFCTVQGAIDAVPADNLTTRTIHIAAGTYTEMVDCSRKHCLTFVGAGRDKTTIRYADNDAFQSMNSGAGGSGNRSMFFLQAHDITIRDLTLHNTTAIGGSQAEAIRIKNCVRVVVRDCNLKSYQDTICADGRVYFWNCYVAGDVDYVWGAGGVYFDKCEFHTMRRGYLCQARNEEGPISPQKGPYGYIFNKCVLTSEPGVERLVFNRVDPSRYPYSNVVMLDCTMGDFVIPAGWKLDNSDVAPDVGYWEYHSVDPQGKPVPTDQRLAQSRQLTDAEAALMRDAARVLEGGDGWNPTIAQ